MNWELAQELCQRLPQVDQVTLNKTTIWWRIGVIEVRFIRSFGKFEVIHNEGTFKQWHIADYDTLDELVKHFDQNPT